MNIYIKSLFIFISCFLWGSFCYAYSSTTTTYWCEGGCGGEIVYQTCHSSQSSCCSSDDDDDEDGEGEASTCEEGEMTTTCGSIIKTGVKAAPWQKCVGGDQSRGSWTYCDDSGDFSHGNKFYFICSGECLYNVDDVRYYDNPTYPKNPELTIDESENYPETCSEEDLKKDNYTCIEPSEPSSSVLLPLKIDWDEDISWMAPKTSVRQFVDDLSYFPVYEEKSTLGAQSYKVTLNNVNSDSVSEPTSAEKIEFSDYISKNFDEDTKEMDQGYFYKILNVDSQPSYIEGGTYRSSEYNFRVDHNPCWFKSSQNYSLKIQTCCNKDGTDCNSGGTFDFTTALAPELKSPEDLDWGGKGYSAWNAWASLGEEDYNLDDDERVLSVPNSKYNPFDWETTSTNNYSTQKVNPPVFLDWCDVSEINGEDKLDKGEWKMRLFQFFKNEKGIEEETLYPEILNGILSLPSEAVYAGVNWTDMLLSNFYDIKNNSYFTENEQYSWEIKPCYSPYNCENFGEHWSFETADSDLKTDFYFVTQEGSVLGIPTEIKWMLYQKANSAKYTVPGITSGETNVGGLTLDNLNLNTNYNITVIPCSDQYSKECEPENEKTLHFKTTGASPEINDFEGSYIPVKISWKNVPGAKSYYYNLNGEEIFIKETSINLDYPKVKSDTTYSFKVKTCADSEGNNCGVYSDVVSFKTEKLKTVENISTDSNGGILYTNNRQVSWDDLEGANYYKYALSYSGDDVSKTCLDFKQNTIESIISDNYFTVGSLCPGEYNLSLNTCLDINCKDYGDTSYFSFYLESKKDPNEGMEGYNSGGGLVPCNREYDDSSTPWDETLACSINHVFLLIRLLFDFFLLRFIPAILVVLLLYTGSLYLFHMFMNFENPAMDLIQKSKIIWKAVGIGILIIFFGWTVINFFLLFFDPSMSTFGSWWDPLN